MKKHFKNIFCVCMAVTLIALTFSGCGSKKINLEDYFQESIPFTGVNGYGDVDQGMAGSNLYAVDKLYEDMIGAKDESGLSTATIEDSYTFDECVSVEVKGNTGKLKNGEEVEVVVTVIPSKLNEMQGVVRKIKEKDTTVSKKYKVSGLQEVKEINPFDAVKAVHYVEGYTGRIVVELKYGYSVDTSIGKLESFGNMGAFSSEESLRITYKDNSGLDSSETVSFVPSVKETDNYRKGMKVRLDLSCEPDKYAQQGVVFTAKSQEFEVKKDIRRAKSPSEISKADLDIIKADADKRIKEQHKEDEKVEFKHIYFSEKGELSVGYYGVFNGRECFTYVKYHSVDLDEEGRIPFMLTYLKMGMVFGSKSEEEYLSIYNKDGVVVNYK